MEGLLQQIVQNTTSKTVYNIYASGKGSSLTTTFQNPIILDAEKEYVMALTGLQSYYSFANINENNNKFFVYEKDWKTLVFPKGCYGLLDINLKLQELLPEKESVTLEANDTTLKCKMKIKKGFKVKFPESGGLSNLLGFSPKTYEAGDYEGDQIVNINQVNTILVHNDIVENSYINGKKQNVIYGFFPSSRPGDKIIQQPLNLLYLPITVKNISVIHTYLTDQDNILLDLQGETLSIQYDIKIQ